MVDSLSVLSRVMDFQSAMETFAEAWVAANVTQVTIALLNYIVNASVSLIGRTTVAKKT